jgi:hypothetical protein
MHFVPRFKYPAEIRRDRNQTYLASTEETLEKAARILEEIEPLDPEIAELKKEIELLRARLTRGDLDRKTAMAEIRKLSDNLEKRLRDRYTKKAKLEDSREELEKNEDTAKLAKAVKSRDKKGVARETSNLRKEMAKLGEEAKGSEGEAREQATSRMREMAKSLNKAAEKGPGKQGGNVPEDLARALDSLGRMAEAGLEQDLPESLLDSLEKGLSEDLMKMLDENKLSARDLEKMKKALQQMVNAEEEARCGQSGGG